MSQQSAPCALEPAPRRPERPRSGRALARRAGRGRRLGAALAALLAGGLALAACSNGTVAQWASATSMAANNTQLRIDVSELETGIRRRQLLELRTACEAFSADAATADGQLPTPNHRLTDELNSAYEVFYQAGVDCYAAKSFDDAKFRLFRSELARGTKELTGAVALFRRLAPGAPTYANPATATGASG